MGELVSTMLGAMLASGISSGVGVWVGLKVHEWRLSQAERRLDRLEKKVFLGG